jgi:hypothetical protein
MLGKPVLVSVVYFKLQSHINHIALNEEKKKIIMAPRNQHFPGRTVKTNKELRPGRPVSSLKFVLRISQIYVHSSAAILACLA